MRTYISVPDIRIDANAMARASTASAERSGLDRFGDCDAAREECGTEMKLRLDLVVRGLGLETADSASGASAADPLTDLLVQNPLMREAIAVFACEPRAVEGRCAACLTLNEGGVVEIGRESEGASREEEDGEESHEGSGEGLHRGGSLRWWS